MGTKMNIPVLMRDDSGEVVKAANATFDPDRGTFRFRVDLDTLSGGHALFGKAIELGLVEAVQLRIVASDFGVETVAAQEELEA